MTGSPPVRKPDRRVEKSKRALRDALVRLMIEKGYDETTVADIAERADVGRSTFYAHYADKEDLLQESLQGLRDYLIEAGAAHTPEIPVHPAVAFSLPMLEHVLTASELFRAHIGKPKGALVREQVHGMLVELVLEGLKTDRTVPAPPRLVAEFIVGAFLSVCIWWMDEPSDLSAREIDRAFRDLVTKGLQGLH